MVRHLFPLILTVLAGGSMVVQQVLNANLRTALNSAVWSGVASYLAGLLCMLALAALLRDPLPSAAVVSRIPWWAWSGGVFGAIFIGLAILLVPQIGAATFMAVLVAGQMLAAVTLDHWGLLGLPVHPANLYRVAGAAFLIFGVVLIRI